MKRTRASQRKQVCALASANVANKVSNTPNRAKQAQQVHTSLRVSNTENFCGAHFSASYWHVVAATLERDTSA